MEGSGWRSRARMRRACRRADKKTCEQRLLQKGCDNYQRVRHGQGHGESGSDEGEGELHIVS